MNTLQLYINTWKCILEILSLADDVKFADGTDLLNTSYLKYLAFATYDFLRTLCLSVSLQFHF